MSTIIFSISTFGRGNRRLKLASLVFAGLASAAISVPGHAGGFQISENTIAGLGRAFAGAGVAGDDASDMYYNPAGLVLGNSRQTQLGVSVLDISGKFSNQGSSQRLLTDRGFVTVPSRGPDSDGGDTSAVPNFFYVSPQIDRIRYGFSITVPFGLRTEYDDNWVGRYHALVSDLRTIDLNPAIAWTVNDNLSLGAGINIQTADAELSRAIFQGPTAPDGKSTLKGDNVGLGFSLGAMYEPSSSTRIGLGFRSKVKQDVDGDITISGTSRDAKLGANAVVTLPETIFLSAYHELDSQWALLGSIRWTNWSRFEELRITFDNNVLPDDVTEENWDDSTSISLGVNYKMNDQWTLRAGYQNDETPIPSAELRTPRIPDADRDWYTFGASYQANDRLWFDFAFARLEADRAPLNNTVNLVTSAPGAFSDTLRGSFEDSSVNIFGAQVLYHF